MIKLLIIDKEQNNCAKLDVAVKLNLFQKKPELQKMCKLLFPYFRLCHIHKYMLYNVITN